MSKMGAEFLRTADQRAEHDADEVAWLRDEVTRLEAEVANRDQVIGGLMERNASLRDEVRRQANRSPTMP
jgi:hypothetical protein